MVAQQLQKKKLMGLWNCSAVLMRTFKKFSKPNRGSASPKPKWVQ